MDLIHISGNTYYFNTPVSIGAIIEDNSAILIDTGLDENAVRKVLNLLKDKNITLKYVINTHSHSDHIGGNAFVESRTKTTFYASEIEAVFIRNPELLSDFIYGATSISELKSKFYYSAPTENVKNIKELKEKFRIVELSHGGLLKNIDAELEENKKQINILLSIIEDHRPDTLENIISNIMKESNISTIDQYFLNRVPVMAAIKYLADQKRINLNIEERRLIVR